MQPSLPLKTRLGTRLNLYLALSRTPHGLLDMTTPALCAVLWLGGLPGLAVTLIGAVTTFAGYTAVYALNDVMDVAIDREKLRRQAPEDRAGYLDAAMVRHPIAQGLLSRGQAVGWVAGWAAVAVVGAALLNPVCLLFFAGGCMLEATYCLMFRVSHHRTLISGVVKTTGGLAAVFAVDPSPAAGPLFLLFAWLFLWEIGGQNIPADWTDIAEDRDLGGRTVPAHLGTRRAGQAALACLGASVALSPALLAATGGGVSLPFALAVLAVGTWLLLLPAVRLYRRRQRQAAMALFNRASFYPLTMLGLAVARLGM